MRPFDARVLVVRLNSSSSKKAAQGQKLGASRTATGQQVYDSFTSRSAGLPKACQQVAYQWVWEVQHPAPAGPAMPHKCILSQYIAA
jgi:hypothetical protein